MKKRVVVGGIVFVIPATLYTCFGVDIAGFFVVGREREGNGDGGGHMEVGSARTRRLATG